MAEPTRLDMESVAAWDPTYHAAMKSARQTAQAPNPKFPAENVYMNSPAFTDVMDRARTGGLKSLSEDERNQVEWAMKLYPQAAGQIPEEVQTQQDDGFFKEFQAKKKKALSEIGNQFAGIWMQLKNSQGDPRARFGQAVVDALDALGRVAGEMAPVSMLSEELTGQKPSHWLSQGFGAIGLNSITEEDAKKMEGVSEPERVALNLVSGAWRLVPELLVGAIENPVGFATGLLTFPVHESQLIIQASLGEKIATPEEVKQARAELSNHPEGVLMLGLMAMGAVRGSLKKSQKMADEAFKSADVGDKKVELPAMTEAEAVELARLNAQGAPEPLATSKPSPTEVPPAAPDPAPVSPQGKKPWEMTRKGYYKQNKPLYHGGPDIPENILRLGSKKGSDAGGIFFTDRPDYAKQYGEHVYETSPESVGKNIFDPRKPKDLAQLKQGFLKLAEEGEYSSPADAIRDYEQVKKLDLLDWGTGSQYVEAIEKAGFSGAVLRERPGNIGLADDGSFTVSGEPIYSVASYKREIPVSRNLHKDAVKQALSEGKPVPPEVLADYPDLAKKYGAVSPQGGGAVKPVGFEGRYDTQKNPELVGSNLAHAKRELAWYRASMEKPEVLANPESVKILNQRIEQSSAEVKQLQEQFDQRVADIPTTDVVRQKHLDALAEDQGTVQEKAGGLGAVGANISKAVTPKVKPSYTPEQVAGAEGPVRDFFRRTEKVVADPVRNLLGWLKEETKKRVVPFYKLRGEKKLEYADTRNDLRLLQDAPARADRDAIDHLRGVIGRLDNSGIDLLRRKVFVEDLLETAVEKGKDIPEGLNVGNLTLEKARLDGIFAKDPDLTAAYNRHVEVWDAVRRDLIDRGKLNEADFYRNYVHHDVLDFYSEHGMSSSGKLRAPKRKYLAEREGSKRDILTDYLAVQYRSLSRVLRDNAIDDGLLAIAKRHHVEGQKGVIPDGYVQWRPGVTVPSGETIGGQANAQMFERMVGELPLEIRAAVAEMAEGAKSGKTTPTFNIPVELAETIDGFRGDFVTSPQVVARVTSMWKQLMLNKNPIRYNRRNMLGDFERALNAMPQAFGVDGFKLMKTSLKEAIDGARGNYSADYKLAMKHDVVGTGPIAREIGELRQLEEFGHLADKLDNWRHPVRAVGRGLRNISTTRENILRYHLFKVNLERMRAGKPMLEGASDARGMADPVAAAGKIARETLGDYGNLTAWEIKQRRGLIPFYSWLKINTTFWPTLFARQGGGTVIRSGTTRGLMFTARKVGQATSLYAAAQAWNEMVQGEQEDQLPEDVRRRFHINTGMKNDKGEWITFTDPTAFSDFMQTTGLEGIYPDVRAMLRGDMTIPEFIGDHLKAPFNALAQRVTPFLKAPAEALTGRSFYPDVFDPRPGETGIRGLAEGLGFREFTSWDRMVKTYGEQFGATGVVGAKAINPGAAALTDSYKMKNAFLEKKGYTGDSGRKGPETDKKRDLFRALSQLDNDRARELSGEIEKKDFLEYLDSRSPYHIPKTGKRAGRITMDGIPNEFQDEFWNSLDKKDADRIERAQDYVKMIEQWYGEIRNQKIEPASKPRSSADDEEVQTYAFREKTGQRIKVKAKRGEALADANDFLDRARKALELVQA